MSNAANNFFIQQEIRKYESRLQGLSQKISRCSTIRDLVRLKTDIEHAGSPVIRPLTSNSTALRDAKRLMQKQGESLISKALSELLTHADLGDDQFKAHAGRFIETQREPSRGHFPSLYHQADGGLQHINVMRHRAKAVNAAGDGSLDVAIARPAETKIRTSLSSSTLHENTPESDLRPMVPHVVNGVIIASGVEFSVIIEASDPMDAMDKIAVMPEAEFSELSNANNQGTQETPRG